MQKNVNLIFFSRLLLLQLFSYFKHKYLFLLILEYSKEKKEHIKIQGLILLESLCHKTMCRSGGFSVHFFNKIEEDLIKLSMEKSLQ